MEKQVDKEHYLNEKYLGKERFISFYYQINPILKLKSEVKDVLEIGVGSGVTSFILKNAGFKVTTADIAEDLHPDKIASVTELSKCFKENSFDMVLCCEVLEHIPFEMFDKALEEMARVTKKYAVISLPYSGVSFSLGMKLPLIKERGLKLKIPIYQKHKFDGEHYWEIGKKGYPMNRIIEHIRMYFKIRKKHVPWEDMASVFFVLEKIK